MTHAFTTIRNHLKNIEKPDLSGKEEPDHHEQPHHHVTRRTLQALHAARLILDPRLHNMRQREEAGQWLPHGPHRIWRETAQVAPNTARQIRHEETHHTGEPNPKPTDAPDTHVQSGLGFRLGAAFRRSDELHVVKEEDGPEEKTAKSVDSNRSAEQRHRINLNSKLDPN